MTTEQRTAFLFPGQGSQMVGMGRKLVERSSIARHTFDEADAALGWSLSELCFEGPMEKLTLTENAQPAILTVSVALARTLAEVEKVTPSIVAGHSLGEYSALVTAGALPFDHAVRAVNKRGQWMQEAVPPGEGGMLALVGVDETIAHAFCAEVLESSRLDGVLSVANLNGGGQVVIAGSQTLCTWAATHAPELKTRVRKVIPLKVSAPFHCALMKPAEEKLATVLRGIPLKSLRCPYIANVDGDLHHHEEGMVDRLIHQVCSPVRWEPSMKRLASSGLCDRVWEVGPGNVLGGLMKRMETGLEVESKGGVWDA